MGSKKRQPPPDETASLVCRRIRTIRSDFGVSQRLAAERIGLSRDQLNRVERERVTPRFVSAWLLCQLTDTNPLWLGFGGNHERSGFAAAEIGAVSEHTPFLPVLRDISEAYGTYRARWYPGVEPDELFVVFELNTRHFRWSTAPTEGAQQNFVAPPIDKRYLTPMPHEVITSWRDLRTLLAQATSLPGAKAALAREFNVSTSAVSQWLSGATAPAADTVLRLANWVRKSRSDSTKSSDRVATQSEPKTQKDKSTSNEKAKSDQLQN